MRDLSKVIGFLIKEVIPTDQTSLHARLNSLNRTIAYSAPEQQVNDWLTLEVILSNELAHINSDWKKRVSDIVTDQEKIPNADIECQGSP